MFNPANETHFSLSIEGLEHDLQVLEFSGREAISQPYRFEVELISENAELDLQSLLHQRAYLAFTPDGLGIHGLIYQVAQAESGKRLTRYKLSVVPQLSYLALRTNQRIFQHLTVPQIVAQVLQEHGIVEGGYQFQLGPTVYPKRDYCVQYDESDLHFVQRLCEEEGIHYHFQHSEQGHVLVFGDDQTPFPKLAPTAYQQDSGLVADKPVIKRFGVRVETRTSRVTRRDYDFEKPKLLMEAEAKSEFVPDLEDYDYPGRFVERERGKHLSQRALERHRHDFEQAQGESDQTLLASGHFLAFTDHPRPSWNDLWLLSEIHHEGKQPQVLEESVTEHGEADGGFQQGYRNRFTATPWTVPYRPSLEHPKPRILGSQSAVVTGPAGEEIHCDEYGRVKVQFFWDRHGQADDKTSCWLRVSSSSAGEQDSQRVQDPEQPRRWRLQRNTHRRQKGRGADLPPRRARLGRKHRARPEDPRRPRTPRHRRGQQLQRIQSRRTPHHPPRPQKRNQSQRPPHRRQQPAHQDRHRPVHQRRSGNPPVQRPESRTRSRQRTHPQSRRQLYQTRRRRHHHGRADHQVQLWWRPGQRLGGGTGVAGQGQAGGCG